MNYLKQIIKKNRMWVAIYIITGIMISFLANYSANFYQTLIDRFTNNTLTFWCIVIYGIILLASVIINYIDEYPGRKLENEIFLDLKQQALKKISKIDYTVYQSLGTGSLIQRIENGSAAGKGILFEFYFRIFRELLPSILFSMFFIFHLNHVIAYGILIGYLIVFLITNLLLRTLYRLKEKILDNEEKMNYFLTRGFMEMVVFRINKRFRTEIQKAENAKNEIVTSKIKMTMIHEAFFTIFAFLITVIKICILIYAWITKSISIGSAIALITLVDNAYTPIAIFNVLFVQYKLDRTAYTRYQEFLDSKEDLQLSDGECLETIEGNISIQNVSFQYNRQTVFNNISLDIRAGEKIALVGESGSGKSTLIKLIVGLLKPEHGIIKIDQHSMDSLCLNAYYDHITYISQESPVFDGTLRENLLFDYSIPDDKVIEILKKVCLYDWFVKLKDGFDTKLGERGVTLSGGERQRLALARLWFTPARIIILDEATSAMDNLTEQMVMKEVINITKGKTLLSIAHRLTSIKDFPRVVVFKNGQIVGNGSFQELLNENSYFHDLYHSSISMTK